MCLSLPAKRLTRLLRFVANDIKYSRLNQMSKNKMNLLDEDKALIAALEAGGYESVKNEAAEIERYTQILKKTEQK